LCMVAGDLARGFDLDLRASRASRPRPHGTFAPELRLLPCFLLRRFDASLPQSLHSDLQPVPFDA
jgi:hypothetical protein